MILHDFRGSLPLPSPTFCVATQALPSTCCDFPTRLRTSARRERLADMKAYSATFLEGGVGICTPPHTHTYSGNNLRLTQWHKNAKSTLHPRAPRGLLIFLQ